MQSWYCSPPKSSGAEIVGLDAGAHGAVEDDDVVVNGVEIAPVGEGSLGVFHGFSLA